MSKVDLRYVLNVFLILKWDFLKYLGSVFPISAKKCEIFCGIFALKFCEFQRFFSRQKPTFLFPAKNLRQPQFMTAPHSGMSQKSRRKVAELRRRIFFFFFLEITFKLDKNDEKIFGIFTLSLERSHYFQHFRRR